MSFDKHSSMRAGEWYNKFHPVDFRKQDYFFFCLILSELHFKPRRKDWVTEKTYIEEFVWGTSLFYYTPSFLCHFLLLSLSTLSPFPSDVTPEWPLQRYIILLWVVFCVMISWVSGWKYENILKFNTSWLTSLRIWYYFRLCFSFSCSGYDLTIIKKSHTLNWYSFLQKFLLKTKTCCWLL